VADRLGEGRLALTALGVTLGAIQAISGASLLERLPAQGAMLLAVALMQAAWLTGLRRGRGGAVAGAVLNGLLVVVWATTRTRQPVGVLDALCAADALAIVTVALALGRPHGGAARVVGAFSQAAIVLAVVSLAAFAGGHTHRDRAAASGTSSPPTHLYCRLL